MPNEVPPCCREKQSTIVWRELISKTIKSHKPALVIDLDKVKEVVDNGKTKVIFLTLPNNPTGNLFSEDTIRSLLDLGVMVVVDEAYYEFSKTTVINLVPDYANLIVLRTFSKWAGLAGLRLGYGVMDPYVAERMLVIKPPYNI